MPALLTTGHRSADGTFFLHDSVGKMYYTEAKKL